MTLLCSTFRIQTQPNFTDTLQCSYRTTRNPTIPLPQHYNAIAPRHCTSPLPHNMQRHNTFTLTLQHTEQNPTDTTVRDFTVTVRYFTPPYTAITKQNTTMQCSATTTQHRTLQCRYDTEHCITVTARYETSRYATITQLRNALPLQYRTIPYRHNTKQCFTLHCRYAAIQRVTATIRGIAVTTQHIASPLHICLETSFCAYHRR